MSINLINGLANQPVDRVLEDLLVRFVINVPGEDLSSIERVFFQVEEAQWFYTDFVRLINKNFPDMKMKGFAPMILSRCPLIWKWGDPSDAIAKFGKYKSTIPVRGVALVNKQLTKVLLVRGTESKAWSFPRGKISKDESNLECAIRETEEETGFDVRQYLSENESIDRTFKGKNYKIYFARNIPEDFNFQPKGRHEIAEIKWFDVKSLQKKIKQNPNHFFLLPAMIKPLIKWITKNEGTVTEEDLMLEAEQKMKDLLGLNNEQKEHDDAGREILNMLHGATANAQNMNNQGVSILLPQNFQPQITQFFDQGQGLPPPYPAHLHYGESAGLNPEALPNPGSFEKPSSTFASHPDSKSSEILSIINRRPVEKSDSRKNSPKPDALSTASNKSKAQTLLDALGRKKDTYSPEPSNELEKSLGTQPKIQPGKVKILKRSETPTEPSTSSSMDLLNLLQKKPESEQPNQSREATKSSEIRANSRYLLDLLKPQTPHMEVNGNSLGHVESQDNSKALDDKALDLSDGVSDEEFHEFEEFEDFGLTGQGHSRTQFTNFDVDSDDDDFKPPKVMVQAEPEAVIFKGLSEASEVLHNIDLGSQESTKEDFRKPNPLLDILHKLPGPKNQQEEDKSFLGILRKKPAVEETLKVESVEIPEDMPGKSFEQNSNPLLSILNGTGEKKKEAPDSGRKTSSAAAGLLSLLGKR